MSIQVRAHTRRGIRVRAYIRGGGTGSKMVSKSGKFKMPKNKYGEAAFLKREANQALKDWGGYERGVDKKKSVVNYVAKSLNMSNPRGKRIIATYLNREKF